MGSLHNREKIKEMRCILGSDVADSDIIRALFMAKDDVLRAINIFFDTPSFHRKDRKSAGSGSRLMLEYHPSEPMLLLPPPDISIATNAIQNSQNPSSQSPNLRVPKSEIQTHKNPLAESSENQNPLTKSPNYQNRKPVSPNSQIPISNCQNACSETPNCQNSNPNFAKSLNPSSENPNFVIPKSENPNFVIPKSENPNFDIPKYQFPKFETPNSEIPKFDIPKSEIPNLVTPKPEFDIPKSDIPKYVSPISQIPSFDAPKIENPNFHIPLFDDVPKHDIPKPKFDLDLSLSFSGLSQPGFRKRKNPKGDISGASIIGDLASVPIDVEKNSAYVPIDVENEAPAINFGDLDMGSDWWLLGTVEIVGYSTCKGKKLKRGDIVTFSFPTPPKSSSPGFWRRRYNNASYEIVRFSTPQCGEVGRLPTDWTKCLIPLINSNAARIEGFCVGAPRVLSLMDSVHLSVGLYIKSELLEIPVEHQSKLVVSMYEDSVNHPLPTLFRMLGKTPYQKAEFTPDDLYGHKRSVDLKMPLLKRQKTNADSGEDNEEVLSDSDLNKLVGSSESCYLEEMDPPSTLLCSLRCYQKQALFWMNRVEKGSDLKKAAKSIHPCWSAYEIADRRAPAVYINAFTGAATTEFPSAMKVTRGGILADAMGLGKTVMTISLMLSNQGRGGCDSMRDNVENENIKRTIHKNGGTLVVCPMSLLGQWKTEIETHTQSGCFSIYVHYGQTRIKDPRELLEYDVVLTTYGVLSASYNSEKNDEQSVLHSIHWFRVILDEAHSIKASKSQSAQAVFALIADCRWCLTGTPIQNKLEDVYSLLRFLQVEPWGNWGWWHKLIQKPYDEGDERGLNLVKAILTPLMLRRTKESTDKEGRPILELPAAISQVIECEFTEAENDFYMALYKRSKVKFDQFVAQGKVLHNYASILELLLRLRQCCDHPFLVLSRGDTQQFADMRKLKGFLGDNCFTQSKVYVESVVEELQNGKKEECPICLELLDDAIITPCAHTMCRECILNSWVNSSTGSCPICRKRISKHELVTLPTTSRFRVDVEKNWKESSKVSALLKCLTELKASKLKSVVFSQWTSFLDLLEIPLKRGNFRFVRLDGSLSQSQRERVIKDFGEKPDVLVMLISLKAGGVGLNLTAASNAFIMDPWWNPAVEEQAIMRIHRIGQKREVSIKRFIIKGTVEERMQEVQHRKQRMIAGALTDQEVRSARIEELKMLFR